MRVLRSCSVLLLLVALPAAVLAGIGDADTRPAALRAQGAVSLSSSLGNHAIFTASRLGPGESARGRVAIRNTGTRPARLALSQSGVRDVEGPWGGRLSERLALTVRDVQAGLTVYSGPFASMTQRDAGLLRPDESRTYELTASLPRSAGNAFQSSSASVRYRWTATESADRPAPPADHRCVPSLRVTPGQRLLRRGRMVARVRVSRACRVTVRAFVTDRTGRRRFLYGLRGMPLTPGRGHSVRLRLARTPRKILRHRRRKRVAVHVTTGDARAVARVRVR